MLDINILKNELIAIIQQNNNKIKMNISSKNNVDKDIKSIKDFAYRETTEKLLENIENKYGFDFDTEEIIQNLLKEEEFDKTLGFVPLNINYDSLIVYVKVEDGKILDLNFDDINLLNEFVKLYKVKYLSEIYNKL